MARLVEAMMIVSLSLGVLAGCASDRMAAKENVQSAMVPATPQEPTEYRIQPGDQLDVKFYYDPELNESVTVRPDGKISLQLVGDVTAANSTPSELSATLNKRYSRELRNPAATVIVKSFSGRQVFVGGEVGRPGLVDLTISHMTALQAVLNAGGFKETANPEEVVIIRKGASNQRVRQRADLTRAYRGEPDADPELQPYDIVYVPKTGIAESDKWVDQHIAQLLLFKGVGIGFTSRGF